VVLAPMIVLSACHFFRAPKAQVPTLSAGRNARTLRFQGQERSYLLYEPKRRRPRAPLVILLHASRQSAEDMRRTTGYAFEALAEQHGFVAVYPESYGRRWNDCRQAGRYRARRHNIDDVGFVLALIDQLAKTADVDPTRVFLVGYSSGAQPLRVSNG
jgi:polyhydroxybutyrate depolymerase